MAGGGVLEEEQCAVGHERLSEALRALGSDAIVPKAAGTGNTKGSAAADTFSNGEDACGRRHTR